MRAKRLARINEDGIIPGKPGHHDERLGDVNRAHHSHAQRRIMDRGEHAPLFIEARPVCAKAVCLGPIGGETALPCGGIHLIGHGLAQGPPLGEVFEHICLKPCTHAKRVKRMQEAGFTPAQIGRLHAPVGLDIGAKSPAEIAISVMAQITAVLRRGTA